jgi:hypothetical protein
MILTLGPSVGSTVAWTWVMMDQMVMMMMMVEGDPHILLLLDIYINT